MSATTLKHDTPLDVRRLAAGCRQAGQQVVGKLKLGRVAQILLEEMTSQPTADIQEVAWRAAMVSGQKGPESKVHDPPARAGPITLSL